MYKTIGPTKISDHKIFSVREYLWLNRAAIDWQLMAYTEQVIYCIFHMPIAYTPSVVNVQ